MKNLFRLIFISCLLLKAQFSQALPFDPPYFKYSSDLAPKELSWIFQNFIVFSDQDDDTLAYYVPKRVVLAQDRNTPRFALHTSLSRYEEGQPIYNLRGAIDTNGDPNLVKELKRILAQYGYHAAPAPIKNLKLHSFIGQGEVFDGRELINCEEDIAVTVKGVTYNVDHCTYPNGRIAELNYAYKTVRIYAEHTHHTTINQHILFDIEYASFFPENALRELGLTLYWDIWFGDSNEPFDVTSAFLAP